jgi:hypothetical protein
MFVPPGYHIQAEVEAEAPPSTPGDPIQPYTYPAGIGSVMMNGCWGTGYKEGDPCFNALEVTTQCRVGASLPTNHFRATGIWEY